MSRDITFKPIDKEHIHQQTFLDEMHGKQKICYLEPKEEISLDLKKILLNEGFNPIGYKDYKELVEKSRLDIPNIILISVTEEQGYDCIKAIKEDEKLSTIFVIATGLLKNSEQKSYDAGSEVYFPKPYMWSVLPFLIRTLLFINSLRYSEDVSNDMNEIKLSFTPTDPITIAEINF